MGRVQRPAAGASRPPAGLGDSFGPDHRPPKDERGIYLLSYGDAHLYVGRTSITARARAADRLEARSFAQRYSEHINAGSQPDTAPLAARIARERARAEGYDSLPAGDVWWSQRKLPIEKRAPAAHALIGYFAAAKSEICTMQLRVLSLHDDDRGVRSTLVELYVHAQLGTPYNDFSTS